jgi:hypothetical protein
MPSTRAIIADAIQSLRLTHAREAAKVAVSKLSPLQSMESMLRDLTRIASSLLRKKDLTNKDQPYFPEFFPTENRGHVDIDDMSLEECKRYLALGRATIRFEMLWKEHHPGEWKVG